MKQESFTQKYISRGGCVHLVDVIVVEENGDEYTEQRPCGRRTLSDRPNGWLCWHHDIAVFGAYSKDHPAWKQKAVSASSPR